MDEEFEEGESDEGVLMEAESGEGAGRKNEGSEGGNS